MRERKRNLKYDQSPKNPLYLQMNVAVREVKCFFDSIPKKGLIIYDFGCGSKPYQVFAGENDYVGIDIDKRNEKADIFSSIDDVPADSLVADIVCSFYVLEHVYNPIDALSEKFRILKSGGELFMLVPLYWEEHEHPYDFWRFTRFSLEKMLLDVGFVDVQTKAINATWAILGLHIVRRLDALRFTRFLVPLVNRVFFEIDQRYLSKLTESGQVAANVMTYAVKAKKN
jgi:SAM-dependent methyltransferase